MAGLSVAAGLLAGGNRRRGRLCIWPTLNVNRIRRRACETLLAAIGKLAGYYVSGRRAEYVENKGMPESAVLLWPTLDGMSLETC